MDKTLVKATNSPSIYLYRKHIDMTSDYTWKYESWLLKWYFNYEIIYIVSIWSNFANELK